MIYRYVSGIIHSAGLLFGLFSQLSGTAQAPCKEIIAYYPNWQWYDRGNLVNPSTIEYSNYTIINYAFFDVLPDGSLQTLDPWADKNLLLGPINWAVAPAGYESSYDFGDPAYHHPGQAFSDHCQAAGVKLVPSLGGWTLSQNFPGIAADPDKRSHFADACVELVEAFDFDGIDIDWEYPGYAPHGGTPSDKENFTLLLQEVRAALDVAEVQLGRELILTIAVGASPANMAEVEWTEVSALVDVINLMSYDYFGAWDPVTNHNAPLTAPVTGNPSFNLTASLDVLIGQYGVDPQKIALGFGFYGRSVLTVGDPGLHVPSTGIADNGTFGPDEGSPLYYSILAQQSLFESHWDEAAQVPYLTGINGLNSFVSFDDSLSVRLKAELAIERELRGAIIWELTGDYIETYPGSGEILGTPLASVINEVFCEPVILGCPMDLNQDGMIGMGDLLIILQEYGCASMCTADLNNDGLVNSSELLMLLAVFGSSCD